MAVNLEEHLTNIRKYEKDDFRWLNLRKIVKKYIVGKQILDAGCGTGHLTIDLLKEGFEVTAIDSSPELINSLRETVKDEKVRLTSFVMDIQNLNDLIHEKFDTIVCLDVLEHIEKDEIILTGLSNVLKNDGTLIVSVPAVKSFFGQRDRNVGHFRRYSKIDLMEKLHHAGFEIFDIRYWNFMGVIPFVVAEKCLHRPLNEDIRYSRITVRSKIFNRLLSYWFSVIENNIRLPVGLTLIVVCKKKIDG